jgi:hypothetical protein
MRILIASLILFVLCLAASTGAAQTLYSNGPVYGDADAWTINSGFVVSDTFMLSSASTVTGFNFYSWLLTSTDVLESAEVSITSSEFGGTLYSDQVVSFAQSGCRENGFGYYVCLESSTNFNPVNLAGGTYWLNLDNAVVNSGDPAYWDENSGMGCNSPGCPSLASENSVGTIPSESFTVLGTAQSSTSTTSTTPEPSSIMLFGSGIIGLIAVVRRKLC